MIFAGNFAQLPPAIGGENASLYSRTVGSRSNNCRQQQCALGKALWHQITSVVILRQNMRQKMQSKRDAQLREALSNMRFKSCTPADIAFLRTLISSDQPGRFSVNDDEFRNASIITALNAHKDIINSIGCWRFAEETGQRLADFYSDDSVKPAQKTMMGTQRNS